MGAPLNFFTDALALADTGAFRSAAKMRPALMLLSLDTDLADHLLAQPDLRQCLDARCRRARRERVRAATDIC